MMGGAEVGFVIWREAVGRGRKGLERRPVEGLMQKAVAGLERGGRGSLESEPKEGLEGEPKEGLEGDLRGDMGREVKIESGVVAVDGMSPPSAPNLTAASSMKRDLGLERERRLAGLCLGEETNLQRRIKGRGEGRREESGKKCALDRVVKSDVDAASRQENRIARCKERLDSERLGMK